MLYSTSAPSAISKLGHIEDTYTPYQVYSDSDQNFQAKLCFCIPKTTLTVALAIRNRLVLFGNQKQFFIIRFIRDFSLPDVYMWSSQQWSLLLKLHSL